MALPESQFIQFFAWREMLDTITSYFKFKIHNAQRGADGKVVLEVQLYTFLSMFGIGWVYVVT